MVNNKSLFLSSVALSAVCWMATTISCQAKEYSIGTTHESKMVNAKILESFEPEIPMDFQGEAFKSVVTARFSIQPDGKFTVALVDPSGNEDIDKLVVKTLKRWKFQPATLDDNPVASTRKIRVEMEIE